MEKDNRFKRVIVKVGTSTLTHENGRLNLKRMERLAFVLSDIYHSGTEVALVSSGAVAAGAAKMGLDHRPVTLTEKQAMAAVGQTELMNMYSRFFSAFGCRVGQILLTKTVTEDPEQWENAKNTFGALFTLGAIPIVNENDSVSYRGIKFGGNDTVSAYVALLSGADLLVNLSDVDCLYTSDPRLDPDAEPIFEVSDINDEIMALGGGKGTSRGTGGMAAKLEAAKLVTDRGCPMIIASGEDPDILFRIVAGKREGTLFSVKK